MSPLPAVPPPPPQWMQSQRPWEDVAREGWMHHDEYHPHVYDQAYVERHGRQAEVHEQHYGDQQWPLQHAPVPLPAGQNLYEATQVVLQPRYDGSMLGQAAQAHQHPMHAERDHPGWQQHQHYDDPDYAAHVSHEEQLYPSSPGRRGSRSTSGSSPLFYPQPKSPIVVNPVALWESSKEQAQRRAWAQRVCAPPDGNAGAPLGWPHAHVAGAPSAAAAFDSSQHVPLLPMDHIDSSQLPRETPWKISHVRHRPPVDAGSEGSGQSLSSGMQFKEGVADDTGAREAAGQILKRWNEAIMARGIAPGLGGIRPEQATHSMPAAETGTDAIRLETTVSCEAEDSKGERTVYRFTLSSTLDIGGARPQPAPEAPAATAANTRGVVDDGSYAANAPVLSRPSSFAMLQESAARASHADSRQQQMDQFADSDARYWRLQRQLIDLEMSQQHREAQMPTPAGGAPDVARDGGFGMSSRGPSLLDSDSPPTPLYRQSDARAAGLGQPSQRRPSAFSIADPESLAAADHLRGAPVAFAGDVSGRLPVDQGQDGPRVAAVVAPGPPRVAGFTTPGIDLYDSGDSDSKEGANASSTLPGPVRPTAGRIQTPFP
ncbi:hypothetical protein IWQ56_003236, partial [Coemansia nantahalensis]